MPRLPMPGSDTDNWGVLLNDFLRVAHANDGTLRCASIDVLSFGTIDRGGVIGYHHEGTMQAALAAVGSDERTLCLSEGDWYIQANLTIPKNITLSIMRGAVLKITDGHIMKIGGRLEAGIYTIFDYPDTAAVAWSYSETEGGSRQTIYPEWWGAIASTYHDTSYGSVNTTAFNHMFSLDTGGNAHPYVVQLQPGAVYYISNTIYIRGWFHVLGERAQITSTLSMTDKALIQIGSRAESKKTFYMEWRGVSINYIGTDPARSSSTGILIDHSDFGIFTNCSIGGWDVGIKSGVGSVNEWTFRNVLVTGCRIGYAMGQRPTDAAPAVSTWEGGKIQQCAELGMHLANMSQFELRSLDFSLNGQGSIKVERCSAFKISVYTEAVGFTPQNLQGTPNNDWKNIHLIDCSGWQIEHCALLMGAANGFETSASAYGIYIEGESRSGQITSTTFVRPRKAAIYIGPACQNITESNNEQRDKVGEQFGSLAVIDESAEDDLTRLTNGMHEHNRRLPNRVARLQNFVVASHDFKDSTWTTNTSKPSMVGMTPGPDGVTPAQVLNFASSSPVTAMEAYSLPIPALEGKTIILEWFHKLIDLDPSPPGLGFPRLRVLLYRKSTTGSNASQTTTGGLYRIGQPGTDWSFNRRQWTIAPGFLFDPAVPDEPLRIIISNLDNNETYRLAIAGICLRVKGESASYYPKFERTGAIDRPATGQALPGIQVLAYGGQAIRLFVAENSPAVLNLSPVIGGSSRWEVGDRCFNSNPTPGGVSSWVCTTAGNPGVWKGCGMIEV